MPVYFVVSKNIWKFLAKDFLISAANLNDIPSYQVDTNQHEVMFMKYKGL